MTRSVFLIVAGDFVKTGGMDRANYALADYLLRNGHEVHLVGYRIAEDLHGYGNVFIHRIPKIFQSYFLSHFLLDHVGRFWARRIRAAGGRVIVNGGNCVCRAVNWVHYVHTQYPPESFFRGPLRWLWQNIRHSFYLSEERKALGLAEKIIVNSERTRRDVESSYALNRGRIEMVYLGVDAEKFLPADAAQKKELRERYGLQAHFYAIFIGALSDRRKGFDVLYEAWRRLERRGDWDVHLLVAGQGGELSAWQKAVRRDRMGGSVTFVGFRTDIPDLLKACDVFVSPVRYESFGLAAQEALCCGVPAVIARHAGIAEIYPSELSGLLLDNVEEPGLCVEGLLRWRGAMAEYSSATRRLADKLRARTWEDMAREIVDLIG